jgi:hypothetical protein
MGEVMLKIIKIEMFCVVFAIVLLSVATSSGQQSAESLAAPVPAQIFTGKKVFVANAGTYSGVAADFKKDGEPGRPYNRLYAAMKSWGRYELVTAPTDADMVFEIRFSDMPGGGSELNLAILAAKTHFRSWTFTELVQLTSFNGKVEASTHMDGFRVHQALMYNPLAITRPRTSGTGTFPRQANSPCMAGLHDLRYERTTACASYSLFFS